ncbi:MAG: Mur ligase family protein [Oscillospiraceae bacterium]|nr:Mur ligase family protein [Oscillospiraceae bacterium]
MNFQGKTVTVVGIGVSNLPLIDFLLAHGAIVTARDIKHKELPNVKTICGEGYLDNITEEYIFRSPGVHPNKFADAVRNGAVLTSEMELFFELCPAKIIGVTGSDGKTTTTTIISKLIEAQFGHVYLGGNIGKPLLPEVEKMASEDYAVVELSSFQLMTMKKSPEIAVVTNISPNHLDYHKDMDEYINAKKNIYLHGCKRLVLNYNLREIMNEIPAVYFNTGEEFNLDILLPGRYNLENYMAAEAATRGICDFENLLKVAKTFGGTENRCEFVREMNGVKYYNSSIDSTPSRTAATLSAFERKVIIICGGSDKHISFDPLVETLCDKAKTVVLTGQTAPAIKTALIKSGKNLPLLIEESNFDEAVLKAIDCADPGDIVILSPACASFDAFPNFEARGNRFKEIVKNLK